MASSSEEDSNYTVKEEPIDENIAWNSQSQRRGSAFSPYKPGTVLTNLQRGNVETRAIPAFPEEFTLYSKAAMGEMIPEDFTPDLDVDERDENGFTFVMWAAFYGQYPTVRLLISNHCNLDLQAKNGETALLLAAYGGHHEIVGLCLSTGANPCHEDHSGNTALMYAAIGDHAHCVSELLENGASLSHTNFKGISTYKLTVAKGCKKVQVVMERHMLRMLDPS